MLRTIIDEKFPELKKLYESDQYSKSLELIHLKNQYNLTVEEVSMTLELSVDEYLRYEDGCLECSLGNYDKLIRKLKERFNV